MNNKRNEFTFTWFIENYSYCWHKNKEELTSPEFTTDDLKGTIWHLSLYPRGHSDKQKGYISFFLNRSKADNGPEDFPIKYELSLLAANGSTLQTNELEYTFKKGKGYGRLTLISFDSIFVLKKFDYLPKDILSVQVKIRVEGNIQLVKEISARTTIGIEKITFLHETEGFSTLEPDKKNEVKIMSSNMDQVITSNLYISDDSSCDGKIIVEIQDNDTKRVLSSCRISLLDNFGKLIPCREIDNRFDATRMNIQKLPLSISREAILKRKSDYLSNDKISLLCECYFSSGIEFKRIENVLHGIPLETIKQKIENVGDKEECEATASPTAQDDLVALYNDQLLTDVEIKTTSKSFPAHKNVLCARSSVFKAMLTNDMKEKNSDCIRVDDMENETVQQLLLFLYSDKLENLQWESAIRLYYAGDKYAISRIKELCSAFLLHKVTVSTAGELLFLADTHGDSSLKKATEDFILKHEEEVFASEEWSNLIKTNAVLVSETMCLKYKI